jgi:hypothetical protein
MMRNFRVVMMPSLMAMMLMSGCHRETVGAKTAAEKAEERAQLQDDRALLEQVPPPVKGKFMAVRSFEAWQNPYLTVQSNMLELHVTRGDANPSALGAGGMLRPENARKVVLDVTLDKLGEAVSSVPGDAWPYGRVVAIEEAHHVPANAEPAVRQEMEKTLARLTELGVAVYDPTEGKLQ